MIEPKARMIERFVKHRYVQLIALAVAVIAGLSTIANVWWKSNHGQTSSARPPIGISSSAPSSSSAPAGSGTPSSASHTSSPQLTSACLDTSKSLVSCDRDHQFEIFSTSGSCTSDALIDYLGGVPGMDTLASGIHLMQLTTKGKDVCVVTPPGSATTYSARRVFDGAAGDAWRRCLDNRFANREVSCAGSHTDEFVFTGVLGVGEKLDCASRATRYLGADFSIYAQDLELRTARQGAASQCLISVRGSNLLTASVRRVGTNALPITPG
jgi:hypothetical protein